MSDIEKKPSAAWTVTKDLLAGTIGGWTQVMVAQPFDTVKVRLQCQPEGEAIYSGVMDCVKKTAAEGPTAFYKGTLSPLIGVGFMVTVQFGILATARRTLTAAKKARGEVPDLSVAEVAGCGSVAGVVSSLISSPVEHVRIRLQLQGPRAPPTIATVAADAPAVAAAAAPSGTRAFSTAAAAPPLQYGGSVDAFRSIFAEHGLRGVFRGLPATGLREAVGCGMYFGVYEVAKRQFAQSVGGVDNLGIHHYLMAGGLSGIMAWIPSYPIDIIKSKIQADVLTGTRRYPGIVAAAQSIARSQGLRGFYRGFSPCFVRAAPVNAMTFLAYEMAMKLLNKFD